MKQYETWGSLSIDEAIETLEEIRRDHPDAHVVPTEGGDGVVIEVEERASWLNANVRIRARASDW